MSMSSPTLIEQFQDFLKSFQAVVSEQHGQLDVRLPREYIVEVARLLRDNATMQYSFLENLCAVDYLGMRRTPRFEVVYHLFSFANAHRICLKVGVPENDPTVPTLTRIFPTANWQEREAYDMMGITFIGHPSLERILMPDDWIGHPQRKDVPLGAEEVAFTINQNDLYARKLFAKE